MDIGFIHIGMMKTGTTYMQNIWMKDDKFSLSWKGSINYLNVLRDSITKQNLPAPPAVDQIKLDIPYQKGQKLVLSNEGFSTSFLNQHALHHKIPDFINYTSSALSQLSKSTPNVLLVVRDPISWIQSIYVQSIKQGSHGTMEDFMTKSFDFLQHSMDLEHIVNCYKRYFSNVYIMPYELFKNDEDKFWKLLSERFEVPFPKTRIQENINPSLDLKRTHLLSHLNKLSTILTDTLINSKEYRMQQEKNQIISQYSNGGQWVTEDL
ncbi:hypothetical protein [Salibacterium lacus]|uniref:Sulfotransferase domain-containing protein n=1 Tax=Salibacterium lacus TaxID=1898109 RepID=A0ABW5T0T1_9BACI